MSASPRVTIAIPTYQRADLLAAAVRSALAQQYENLLVLVVDNASSDSTSEICARLAAEAGPRFRWVRNERNLGMHGNFQRCADLAEGKYFKILCSDDRAHPELVARQVAVLEAHPTAVAAAARRRRVTASLAFRLYDPLLRMRPGLWRGADAVRYVFRVSNMIGGPAQVLTRLDAWRTVGRFRTDAVVGNMFDLEPLLRLLAGGHDLYVMGETLCDYNSEVTSFTTATLTDPRVQEFLFAFREEQARDPLYAACLELPGDLEVSRRNAALLLLLAGAVATLPRRERERARRLFDFVAQRHPALWVKAAREALLAALALPGGRASRPR